MGAGGVDLHVADACVRIRAADEGDLEGPVQPDVVEEPRPPTEKLRVFHPRDAAADVPERPAHEAASRSSRAASRTAATIPV